MPESPQRTVDALTRKNIETIAGIDRSANANRSRGERVADSVAKAIGSWPFIITQSIILAIWVTLNVIAWVKHWDPYPFILLNLALSFQAAYASPIIMMSQNRQARLDERRNRLDLQINLLSEQENTEMLRLLRLLCERAGVPKADYSATAGLEEATNPEALIRQIDEITREEAHNVILDFCHKHSIDLVKLNEQARARHAS